MVTISKNNVSEWLLLDSYYEKHTAIDKTTFFQRKYNSNFSEFEKRIKQNTENFIEYDDYIEWKAYQQLLSRIEERISDIKNGNFRIS